MGRGKKRCAIPAQPVLKMRLSLQVTSGEKFCRILVGAEPLLSQKTGDAAGVPPYHSSGSSSSWAAAAVFCLVSLSSFDIVALIRR